MEYIYDDFQTHDDKRRLPGRSQGIRQVIPWNSGVLGHCAIAQRPNTPDVLDRLPPGVHTTNVFIPFIPPRGRSFKVRIQKNLSDRREPEACLLQGAILSSELYSIYTADIPISDISWERKSLIIYADDRAVAS